jgi:hypothetical protein
MKNTCLAILSRRNLEAEAFRRRQKAQFASKRGSVENYVTKSVAAWNTALPACRF